MGSDYRNPKLRKIGVLAVLALFLLAATVSFAVASQVPATASKAHHSTATVRALTVQRAKKSITRYVHRYELGSRVAFSGCVAGRYAGFCLHVYYDRGVIRYDATASVGWDKKTGAVSVVAFQLKGKRRLRPGEGRSTALAFSS